jgi:hypothetical protein
MRTPSYLEKDKGHILLEYDDLNLRIIHLRKTLLNIYKDTAFRVSLLPFKETKQKHVPIFI